MSHSLPFLLLPLPGLCMTGVLIPEMIKSSLMALHAKYRLGIPKCNSYPRLPLTSRTSHPVAYSTSHWKQDTAEPSIFSSQTCSSCSITHPAEGSSLHPNAQAEVSPCSSLSYPLPNQKLVGTGSTFNLNFSPPLPPAPKQPD